jgi:hypothetical protein
VTESLNKICSSPVTTGEGKYETKYIVVVEKQLLASSV